MYRLSRRYSLRCAAVSGCLAMLASAAATGTEVSGWIRLSDENFAVDVHTAGNSLTLAARGCNNFDLSLVAQSSRTALQLHDARGNNVGTIGPGRVLESRTCGAERYTTQLTFAAPSAITWSPEADETRATKQVKYAAVLPATQIRFDPPVTFTVFDSNRRARPTRIPSVASVTVPQDGRLSYRSEALRFSTPEGKIRRDGGFVASDEFSLTTGSRNLALPRNTHATEIAFEGTGNRPVSFSLYYPISGPHVLAFFADDAQREPVTLASLRIDGEQQLTPSFELNRAEPLIVERSFFHFLSSREETPIASLELQLGSAGIDVRRVQIDSAGGTLELAADPSGPFESSLTFPKVMGGVAFEIFVRARVPATWQAGERTETVIVRSEGGLERQIPITIQVVDRYSRARTVLLFALAAIVLGVALRMLATRRKLRAREADARVLFYQNHHDEYVRVREQVETLLAGEPSWPETEALLTRFTQRGLQAILNAQENEQLEGLMKAHKARAALELIEQAIAKFD